MSSSLEDEVKALALSRQYAKEAQEFLVYLSSSVIASHSAIKALNSAKLFFSRRLSKALSSSETQSSTWIWLMVLLSIADALETTFIKDE